MSKSAKWVMGLIIVSIVGVGAYYAGNYYNDRYVGEDYYTKIPSNTNLELEDIKDQEGVVQATGYEYKLAGYNTQLQKRTLEFSQHATKVEDLYQPGTYLKISVSKQIVLSEEVVNASAVPTQILELLQD